MAFYHNMPILSPVSACRHHIKISGGQTNSTKLQPGVNRGYLALKNGLRNQIDLRKSWVKVGRRTGSRNYLQLLLVPPCLRTSFFKLLLGRAFIRLSDRLSTYPPTRPPSGPRSLIVGFSLAHPPSYRQRA